MPSAASHRLIRYFIGIGSLRMWRWDQRRRSCTASHGRASHCGMGKLDSIEHSIYFSHMRSVLRTDGQRDQTFIEKARRAQIIACTIDAIVELGFAKASLDQIARRAGISKGVISYHFASKEELTRQVVADVFAAGSAYMEPRIRAAATATDRLRTYIESNIAFISSNRKPIAALMDIAANARDREGKPLVGQALMAPRIAGLGELLRGGQDSGEFRPFDVRVMAFALIQSIDGIPPALVAKPDLDLGVLARELTTLFHLATRKETP